MIFYVYLHIFYVQYLIWIIMPYAYYNNIKSVKFRGCAF